MTCRLYDINLLLKTGQKISSLDSKHRAVKCSVNARAREVLMGMLFKGMDGTAYLFIDKALMGLLNRRGHKPLMY